MAERVYEKGVQISVARLTEYPVSRPAAEQPSEECYICLLLSLDFFNGRSVVIIGYRRFVRRTEKPDYHQYKNQRSKQEHQVATVLDRLPTGVRLAWRLALGQNDIGVVLLLKTLQLKHFVRQSHCRCHQSAVEIERRSVVAPLNYSIIAAHNPVADPAAREGFVYGALFAAGQCRFDMIAVFSADQGSGKRRAESGKRG